MTVPQAAYSPVRRAGEFLFVSGQLGVSFDVSQPPGTVAEQTAVALARLAELLRSEGATLSDVVKCTVFLADMADWAEMNDVYAATFGVPYPARSAVGSELAMGALVEIDAVALRPRSDADHGSSV